MPSTPPPLWKWIRVAVDYYFIALFHYYAQGTLKEAYIQDPPPPANYKKGYYAIIAL